MTNITKIIGEMREWAKATGMNLPAEWADQLEAMQGEAVSSIADTARGFTQEEAMQYRQFIDEYFPAPPAVPEGMVQEAARYRWLRDNGYLNDEWWSVAGPEDRCANIDADIDAAMIEGRGE